MKWHKHHSTYLKNESRIHDQIDGVDGAAFVGINGIYILLFFSVHFGMVLRIWAHSISFLLLFFLLLVIVSIQFGWYFSHLFFSSFPSHSPALIVFIICYLCLLCFPLSFGFIPLSLVPFFVWPFVSSMVFDEILGKLKLSETYWCARITFILCPFFEISLEPNFYIC